MSPTTLTFRSKPAHLVISASTKYALASILKGGNYNEEDKQTVRKVSLLQ